MVEKLELEIVAHLSPYKVLWLQKGHQVTVTKQCLVEFKIGGYRDDILCDVIPMDVFRTKYQYSTEKPQKKYSMP